MPKKTVPEQQAKLLEFTDLTTLNIRGNNKQGERKRIAREKIELKMMEIRRIHDELNVELGYDREVAETPTMSGMDEVVQLMIPFLTGLLHEEMWLMVMNRRMKLLKLVKALSGSVNSVQINVGEIFREAIIEGGSYVIFVHNHPSGNSQPSPDDIVVTRRLVEAGNLLNIEVIDHVIFGFKEHTSMKAMWPKYFIQYEGA